MASKILIIDDDQFTRQVLSKILSRDKNISAYKPSIIEASNGMEALRLFEIHKPSLVIVDLLMPKMDGFEVCRRLRELADKKALTIAVTSGVYKDAKVASGLRDDFNAEFFAKPYQIKKIVKFIARALAPAGTSKSKRASTQQGDPSEFSGKLRKRSSAKILLDLLEQEKSGRLMLRRGQVVRQIEIYVGHPVSITTNVREETLGHFLVSKKRIDSETHRTAMNLASNNRIRFGEAVIEMGVLTANELIQELTAQTRYKLVNSLRWHDGTWNFRPGQPRNVNSNALNVVEVIVSGLASTIELEPKPPTLSALSGKTLKLNSRGKKLLAQISSSVSPSFAKKFSANNTIAELEGSGVNHVEVYTCLDILQQCGGLESEDAEGVPKQVADDTSDSFKLQSIARAHQRRGEGPDLIDSLFEDQVTQSTTTGKSPLTELGSVELWKSLKTRGAGSAPQELVDSAEEIVGEDSDEKTVVHAEERRRRRRSSIVKAEARKNDEVVDVSFSVPTEAADLTAGRSRIIGEFLRIQDKSLYEVLKIEEDAKDEEIQNAHDWAVGEFDKAQFTELNLGRDFQKLDVLHATYDRCAETLLNNEKRARYDKSLHLEDEAEEEAPSMDAEIAFREGERLLQLGNNTGAMEKLREAVEISPGEAAYKAELGWTIFLQGKKEPSAADEARTYINEALAKMPDDVLANEYKGLIDAHLGADTETALLHLERALKHDPRRVESLRKVEELRIERGEYHKLKQLYLRLLFGLKGSSTVDESLIWCRLGDLHLHYLSDNEAALVAYEAAAKLTPLDESISEKIRFLQGGDLADFYAASRDHWQQWQEAPGDSAPLVKLLELAKKAEHADAVYLAASALVATGDAEDEAKKSYQQRRPKYLLRAQCELDTDRWMHALAPEDYPLVDALYGYLGPSIQKLSPPTDAEQEVAQAQKLDPQKLPTEFQSVLSYVAHTLGVHEPAVYTHADYGRVIHVAALEKPALMVGRQTLECSDKLELAFRLGRAMSFLRPGRAVVAGCPTRTLKNAMLACYSLRSPRASVPDPDGEVEKFKVMISQGDESVQDQLVELVSHISQEHPSLNLSRWVRTLNRTADRVGLLLCGDLLTSLRCLADASDTKITHQLIAFAVSDSHMQLRQSMGLSVEV